MVGLGLVIAQQLTGQPNVMTYAGDIAQSVGFCGDALANIATILLGMIKVFATLASLLLVDKLGRRTLLLSGVGVITVSLMCLVATSSYQEIHDGVAHQACHQYQSANNITNENTTMEQYQCKPSTLPRHISIISFISLVSYIAAYSVSFGPISWILLSELFPLNIKARAMSLGQAVNWTMNVLVSVTFLDMVHVFTLPTVFGFYLTMSLLSLVFIYFYVPETKNKSLEEISFELRQRDIGEGGFQSRHKTLSPLPAVRSSPSKQINMQLRVIQS